MLAQQAHRYCDPALRLSRLRHARRRRPLQPDRAAARAAPGRRAATRSPRPAVHRRGRPATARRPQRPAGRGAAAAAGRRSEQRHVGRPARRLPRAEASIRSSSSTKPGGPAIRCPASPRRPTSMPTRQTGRVRSAGRPCKVSAPGLRAPNAITSASSSSPSTCFAPARRGGRFASTTSRRQMIERYGDNRFGRSCLVARRLIEAGVGLVTVPWMFKQSEQNFDTHSQHFTKMKNMLLPPVDRAFSALLEDLAQRGHAGRDAGGLDGRVRPHAADQRRRAAATTGAACIRRCWPAAACAAARSSAAATRRAACRPTTRCTRPTSSRRCITRSATAPTRASPTRSAGRTSSSRASRCWSCFDVGVPPLGGEASVLVRAGAFAA